MVSDSCSKEQKTMAKKTTTKKATPKAAAKKPRAKKLEKKKPVKHSGKLGALDAAAKVLAETKQPMTCKEMVETMAAKGYWNSPAGRTPDRTLCSAIIRETRTKGKEARFKKVGRGKFTRNGLGER